MPFGGSATTFGPVGGMTAQPVNASATTAMGTVTRVILERFMMFSVHGSCFDGSHRNDAE
jgi:hypothetical protein